MGRLFAYGGTRLVLVVTLIVVGGGGGVTALAQVVNDDRQDAAHVAPMIASSDEPAPVPATPLATAAPVLGAPTAQPDTPRRTPLPTPRPSPLPARGSELPRGSVPWEQVDSRWTLAVYAPNVTVTEDSWVVPAGGLVLYLVTPDGGRYRLAALPNHVHRIRDWSLRSSTAVVVSWGGGAGERHTKVDLRTGRLTPIRSMAPFAQDLGPAGRVDGSSRVVELPIANRNIVGTSRGIAVVDDRGRLVHALPAPRNAARWLLGDPSAHVRCDPTQLMDADRVQVACWSAEGVSNAWRVELGRNSWTQLTFVPPKLPVSSSTRQPDYYEFGVLRAWATDIGPVAELDPTCGAPVLGLSHGDWAKFSMMDIPDVKGIKGSLMPLTVDRRSAWLLSSGCAGGTGRSLVRYDFLAHTAVPLLGPGFNGGSVIDATYPYAKSWIA